MQKNSQLKITLLCLVSITQNIIGSENNYDKITVIATPPMTIPVTIVSKSKYQETSEFTAREDLLRYLSDNNLLTKKPFCTKRILKAIFEGLYPDDDYFHLKTTDKQKFTYLGQKLGIKSPSTTRRYYIYEKALELLKIHDGITLEEHSNTNKMSLEYILNTTTESTLTNFFSEHPFFYNQ